MELLREERSSELASSLASWYGTGAAPLTTEEILQVLEQKGASAQLMQYRTLEAMLSGPLADSNKEDLRRVLATMVGLAPREDATHAGMRISGITRSQPDHPETARGVVLRRNSPGA